MHVRRRARVLAGLVALFGLGARDVRGDVRCEETFHDPASGISTTVSVAIDTPEPGTEIRGFAPACPAEVEVRGVASTLGLPPRFDIYLVLDTSGSTRFCSGADVDADGETGVHLTAVCSDPEDDILHAEARAAELLLDVLDPDNTRVALVSFAEEESGVVTTHQGLTDDHEAVRTALGDVLSAGSRGATDFDAALREVLAEHDRRGDDARVQVILFLSDGVPNAPTRPFTRTDGDEHCVGGDDVCLPLIQAARAADEGIVLHAFAVGSAADRRVLPDMAARTGGEFFALEVPGEILEALPGVLLAGIAELRVIDRTTGTELSLAPTPDGRFAATLPATSGFVDLAVVAVADGDPRHAVECRTDVTLTCIETLCPEDVRRECERDGATWIDGLRAWSSDGRVRIGNDSPRDDTPPRGDADASGLHPVGTTRVAFTFEDESAGTRTCSTRVTVEDTSPPQIRGGPSDVTVECDDVPGPEAPSVEDACDPEPRMELEERRIAGRCADEHELTRTWTVTDASGNLATFVQRVSVVDRTGPTLLGVPADATVECDEVPPPASVTAVDGCDPDPSLHFAEEELPGDCPSERTLVRAWRAEDRCGNAAAARQVVRVVDTTPPVVAASLSTVTCLWPPNHWYVCFRRDDFRPTVTDRCSAVVEWRFTGCASDQPDDAVGVGDGHTVEDCVVAPDGETLCVRAERDGTVPAGRSYAVVIVATDGCGNESEPTPIGTIHVPHDQAPRRDECRNPTREGVRRNREPPL